MARLPTVGGDIDGWGTVLNEFLSVEHASDGSHKRVNIVSSTTGISLDPSIDVDGAQRNSPTIDLRTTAGSASSSDKTLKLFAGLVGSGPTHFFGIRNADSINFGRWFDTGQLSVRGQSGSPWFTFADTDLSAIYNWTGRNISSSLDLSFELSDSTRLFWISRAAPTGAIHFERGASFTPTSFTTGLGSDEVVRVTNTGSGQERRVPVRIRAMAAQTGNLLEVQDNSGSNLVSITSSGYLRIKESVVNPTSLGPVSLGEVVGPYMKGDKLIFAYNNAGSLTYIYLTMNGSSTTWVHTIAAP